MNNNCNLTTCRYNENGKCTNEEKRKECVEVAEKVLVDRLSPSELLMHLSDGIGNTESLKKFGIEIDLSKFEDDKAEICIRDFEDKLLTEIMEKHYKEFGLNEENRYIFRDVVEKYGDMTYRHLCENYCFAFEKE